MKRLHNKYEIHSIKHPTTANVVLIENLQLQENQVVELVERGLMHAIVDYKDITKYLTPTLITHVATQLR
jgi:hypothetical protein